MKTIQPIAMFCMLSLSAATTARSAQAPEDAPFAPFRGGQWAAQFGASPSFVSLGFLRYTSAKSAWLLDARFKLTELDAETSTTRDTLTESFEQRRSDGSFNARIGRRFYPTVEDRVAGFFTVGATGGYGRDTQISPFGRFRVSTWSIGVFADLGADYFLTSKLSIGGTFGLQALYTRRDTDRDAASGATDRTDTNTYNVSLSPASLVLSLYF